RTADHTGCTFLSGARSKRPARILSLHSWFIVLSLLFLRIRCFLPVPIFVILENRTDLGCVVHAFGYIIFRCYPFAILEIPDEDFVGVRVMPQYRHYGGITCFSV